METSKKDHSKDEYYLTFAMRGPNYDSEICCPLDNNLIKNGYIDDKGMYNHRLPNSDDRQFKCFSLHPIIDGEDIVDYTYGSIGYDLNPESMRIYVGGWGDLRSNNDANRLANDPELLQLLSLSTKKNDNVYFGDDHVDKVMYKKILNRAKLLKETIKNSKGKDLQEILQAMFETSNKKDDDSFREGNYHLKQEGNIWKLTGNKVDGDTNQEFHRKYGVNIDGNFELIYDEKDGKLYSHNTNELNGVAKDKNKGIKVDRIFVKEENYPDYGLNNLKKLQQKARNNGEEKYKYVYDNYIKKLTDVFIEQFPFGEIRVVKGSIYTGQTNEFLSPEEFIEQYFVKNEDMNDYLKKLKEKRDEVNQQNGRNNEVGNERQQYGNEINNQTKSDKFLNILSSNDFKCITKTLDPKSNTNKIFLNKKYLTKKGIIKSQLNKVFDAYSYRPQAMMYSYAPATQIQVQQIYSTVARPKYWQNVNQIVPKRVYQTVGPIQRVVLRSVPAPVPAQTHVAPVPVRVPTFFASRQQRTNNPPERYKLEKANGPIDPMRRYRMFDGCGYLYSPMPIYTKSCNGGLSMYTDALAKYEFC